MQCHEAGLLSLPFKCEKLRYSDECIVSGHTTGEQFSQDSSTIWFQGLLSHPTWESFYRSHYGVLALRDRSGRQACDCLEWPYLTTIVICWSFGVKKCSFKDKLPNYKGRIVIHSECKFLRFHKQMDRMHLWLHNMEMSLSPAWLWTHRNFPGRCLWPCFGLGFILYISMGASLQTNLPRAQRTWRWYVSVHRVLKGIWKGFSLHFHSFFFFNFRK